VAGVMQGGRAERSGRTPPGGGQPIAQVAVILIGDAQNYGTAAVIRADFKCSPSIHWQRYFTKWDCATRSRLSSSQLEIVSPLSRLIPPATVIDKPAYSAFTESGLATVLREKGVDTLIITGSETDVCVLATVLDAVDLGFQVIVVEDALCSSFDEGHDALMTLYRNRFSEQVELMTHAHVSDLWRDPL
jgi:nicotinamidase-related amidase